MATVVALADYGIQRLLTKRFYSRALVRYLRDALRDAQAPYVVVRIIADALSEYAQQDVSPQTVARLSLHQDPSFELVYRALCELFDDFMSMLASLGMQIVADLAEQPKDLRAFRGVAVPKRQGVDESKEKLVSYLRIYQCTLAMLLGVHLEA